jgi:hypothetical protein
MCKGDVIPVSIIYDALQKTQRNREYLRIQNALTQKTSPRRHLKWLVLGVLIVASGGGVGALSFYSLAIGNLPSFHLATKTQPSVKTKMLAQTQKSQKTVAVPPLTLGASQVAPPFSNRETTAPVSQTLAPVVSQVRPRQEEALPVSEQTPLPPPPFITHPVAEKPPIPEIKPLLSTRLTLNGVMISGDEKVALINNQAFHLGDVVDGMRIVAIEFNNIKLQSGNEVFELRVSV